MIININKFRIVNINTLLVIINKINLMKRNMREFFNRVEDNELVKIEVDLAAKDFQDTHPWLFSIFIKYDAFEDTDEKVAEFFELKEQVIMSLEYKDSAYYIGNRIIDNWSEIYFCAEDSKGLEAIANSVLKSSGYVFECNVVKDAKWEFYDFNIYPTDLEMCLMQSFKITELLEEEGDNLSTCREVEHYASFETSGHKDRFLEKATQAGYAFKDDLDAEEYDHGVAIIKEHAISEEDILQLVSEVFALVESENGSYELWSTLIQEKE